MELMNNSKVYIFRVVNHNGRKEYKRTKCTDHWTDSKSVCWQFSLLGAKRIVSVLNSRCVSKYYTYGYETASR